LSKISDLSNITTGFLEPLVLICQKITTKFLKLLQRFKAAAFLKLLQGSSG